MTELSQKKVNATEAIIQERSQIPSAAEVRMLKAAKSS